MNDLQTKLDRLADGELSREEYAALLATLDHEDEGWKKCALTFLESQALRGELRELVHEPPAPAKISLPPTSERFHAWQWIQGIALAACLGLAFWLGRGSMTSDVDIAVAPPPRPKSHAIATEPWKQGKITLVVHGPDGQPREMELPVVDGNYVDPEAFLARTAVIPPDVLAAIERSGHRIERHREFMRQPVDAEHEVVVPVDRLRVVPVSNPMY
jgi:hypothetical protein